MARAWVLLAGHVVTPRRYHFATDRSKGKAKARRLARATPGGRKTRYRQLPARRPGRHVQMNSAGTGFILKSPRYKGK